MVEHLPGSIFVIFDDELPASNLLLSDFDESVRDGVSAGWPRLRRFEEESGFDVNLDTSKLDEDLPLKLAAKLASPVSPREEDPDWLEFDELPSLVAAGCRIEIYESICKPTEKDIKRGSAVSH